MDTPMRKQLKKLAGANEVRTGVATGLAPNNDLERHDSKIP
jgi:hypothetical protein